MHRLAILLSLIIATPLSGHQERECRGKSSFQLDRGIHGCIFEIGSSAIARTTRIDGGAAIASRDKTSALVDVLLFGPFDDHENRVRSRIQAICKTFAGDIETTMAGVRYTNAIVRISWPRVAGNPLQPMATQIGFTTAQCRGAEFYDR